VVTNYAKKPDGNGTTAYLEIREPSYLVATWAGSRTRKDLRTLPVLGGGVLRLLEVARGSERAPRGWPSILGLVGSGVPIGKKKQGRNQDLLLPSTEIIIWAKKNRRRNIMRSRSYSLELAGGALEDLLKSHRAMGWKFVEGAGGVPAAPLEKGCLGSA